ncbi:hypothetical protein BH20BAC1_BH20BAC1_21950 [soil metagenome]
MIFLVDVNLPRIFNQLQPGEFIFVHDINRRLADTELWQLSLQNDYVILTRDMDFYYRAIESINIPKIVIFRFHNLKLKISGTTCQFTGKTSSKISGITN